MKIVDEMPTEGQFIKVWKFNDMLWSWTLKWEDGVLFLYVDSTEDQDSHWEAEGVALVDEVTDIHYIIE